MLQWILGWFNSSQNEFEMRLNKNSCTKQLVQICTACQIISNITVLKNTCYGQDVRTAFFMLGRVA